MRNSPQFIITILLLSFVTTTFAQNRNGRAKLIKNRNIQASGLYHDFNKTKDSLVLKSDKKINYLYTANHNDDAKLSVLIDSNSYKLPLHKLKKGRNVLVAIQSPLKIVFVVEVEEEFPKPVESTLLAVD